MGESKKRVHPLLKIDESLVRISFAVPRDEMVRGKIGCNRNSTPYDKTSHPQLSPNIH